MDTPSAPRAASLHADRVAGLTGVRAFAALWVVAYHSWLVSGSRTIELPQAGIDVTRLLSMGWLGVDIFFVLSGFVLTYQALVVAPPSAPGRLPTRREYWKFVRRRILRVYPAYYACLTVLLAAAGTGLYLTLPTLPDLLLHLAMIHNATVATLTTINGVFWTLPFEWQFYLVFPLLLVPVRRGAVVPLAVAAILVATATRALYMYGGNHFIVLIQLPARIDCFVLGMCAARLALAPAFPERARAPLFWLGLAALVATTEIFAARPGPLFTPDWYGYAKPVWSALAVATMLVGMAGDRHRGCGLFDNRLAVWLGTVSYSIYLWHVPVLDFLPYVGAYPFRGGPVPIPLKQVLVTVIPAVCAVAALSYYAIERPFLAARGDEGTPPSLLERAGGPIRVLVVWAVLLVALWGAFALRAR